MGNDHFYFSQTFAANSDIWYVRPEYRGGLIGVLLLRNFEKWAIEKGARFLVNGSFILKKKFDLVLNIKFEAQILPKMIFVAQGCLQENNPGNTITDVQS